MVNTEPVTDPSQILTQLEVSLHDVRQALHALDPRKAPGCDGLPTRLIVMVADEIAPCVHHIFTLSLRTANLPPDWKSAIVSPVYKERGSRQQASNYRPISLLSVLSKCLEKVVFKPLYSHLNRFLPKHQSGFRQKDSTAYQLARLLRYTRRTDPVVLGRAPAGSKRVGRLTNIATPGKGRKRESERERDQRRFTYLLSRFATWYM